MNGLELVFVVTLAFMAWSGWRLGLRQVLIQSLSSLLALVCSTFITPLLVDTVGDLLNPAIVWVIGGTVLFVAVLLVSRRVLLLMLEPMQPRPLVSKWGGMLLNGSLGVLVAGLVVWSLGLMGSIMSLSSGQAAPHDRSALAQAAGLEMQYLVTWSARASRLEPLEANLMGLIAANPEVFMADIKQLAITPAVVTLLQNEEVLNQMRNNNLAQLRTMPSVVSFLAEPAAQDLARRIASAGYADGEAAVLQQLKQVWRGYDSLLHDPEIQRLLLQGTLMEQMKRGDQLGIMLNPDFSLLVRRLTLLMQAPGFYSASVSLPAPIVYSWQSEDAITHLSPWAEVPPKFRPSAIPIKQP